MRAKRFFRVGLCVITSLLMLTTYAHCQKISLTWWSPNWSAEGAKEIVGKFEKENPNITVDIEETVWEGMRTKILVALKGGSPPDVIDVAVYWVIPYASEDLLMDLTEHLDEIEIEDFFQSGWKSNEYKGGVYGLPVRSEGMAFVYNKEVFRAAGLEPKAPETMEELVEFSKELTVDKDGDGVIDQYGLMMVAAGGGQAMWHFLPFVWAFGGDIFNPEHTRAAIAEEPALRGAEFYADLVLKYKVAPPGITTYTPRDTQHFYNTGKAAMGRITSIGGLDPDIDFGTALAPRGPAGRDVPLGGWNVIIPKDAKHPEEAWKFVKFFVQPENMAAYTATLPGRKSAAMKDAAEQINKLVGK